MNPPRINGRGDKSVTTRRAQCSLLRDIVESAEVIRERTAGKTLSDYLGDIVLRGFVERYHTNIGEAMAQLARRAPATAERFANYQDVIGFRNFLVHQYPKVDNEKVWAHTVEDLPPLLRQARALLAECEDGE